VVWAEWEQASVVHQDVDVACQNRRGRGQRPHAVDVTETSGEEIGTADGSAGAACAAGD
jgi:hypothetical protein